LRCRIAVKAGEQRIARSGRLGAVQILAAQGTERQAGIGQQFNALVLADLCQSDLKAAVQQAVGVLNRDNARQLVFFSQLQVAHYAPRRFIGYPDIADFTGAHLLGQRFQRFQQGNRSFIVGVLIIEFAEVVGLALRPVQLIKIEIIGVQPFQACVQRGADIFAVQRLLRPNAAVGAAYRPGDFAGQHYFLTVATRLDPTANVLFGQPLGFRAGRYRIHFCGIDQVDASG
jgi:hypothetical protein